MALTETISMPLGFQAPAFTLPDVISGKMVTFDQLKGKKGTVVMFICNHCPFVIHVKQELTRLANDYIPKGIGFIAICSNDATSYPEDAPDKMKIFARDNKFPFPYLHDETQDVARAYFAACTPDFSIFDAQDKCVYRGRLDESRPGNGKPITGKDIRDTLDALLAGKAINAKQFLSAGCNIKWRE